MPESVEFLFSPGSRYCYLAASQAPVLEAETGCRVDWRPVDGRALRALRGHDPFLGESPSGQYDWTYRRTDAEAWADYYGIPFREPPAHELDFDLLVRAATVAKRLGRRLRTAGGSVPPSTPPRSGQSTKHSASASRKRLAFPRSSSG